MDRIPKELLNEPAFKEFAQVIKDTVCTHQKLIVECALGASSILRDFEKACSLDEIRKNIFYLRNHFLDKLEFAFRESVECLNRYYGIDNRRSPRIILKGLRRRDNYVVDRFRSIGKPLDEKYAFPVTSNTAFIRIINDRSSYLENDIPSQAKLGSRYGYKNARLKKRQVDKYQPPLIDQSLKYISLNEYLIKARDKKWEECWKGYSKGDLPAHSCYKSTLVIPVALSHIDRPTRQLLNISDLKFETALFGFLCFDDVCTGFFEPERDKNVGFVFADLLSLYMIIRYAYFGTKVIERALDRPNNRELVNWKEHMSEIKAILSEIEIKAILFQNV